MRQFSKLEPDSEQNQKPNPKNNLKKTLKEELKLSTKPYTVSRITPKSRKLYIYINH